MVNLFGKGFIGTRYAEMFPCIINDRNDLVPQSENLLYLISTIDNYNVKTNPYLDIETNLVTLIRVLENWRVRFPQGVFNFASSWFVYGDADLPAKEGDYCNPKGFYSITKRTAEQLLISYCETYNLRYRILRFANVLGPGDKKASKKKNAVTYMINRMKKNLPIEVYGNGEFERDYVHVDDLCNAINLILGNGDVNSIYNVGNGIPIKFIDVLNVAVKLGSKSQINMIETLDTKVQVSSMYMDNNKLRKLGYMPKFTIESIVSELFDLE